MVPSLSSPAPKEPGDCRKPCLRRLAGGVWLVPSADGQGLSLTPCSMTGGACLYGDDAVGRWCANRMTPVARQTYPTTVVTGMSGFDAGTVALGASHSGAPRAVHPAGSAAMRQARIQCLLAPGWRDGTRRCNPARPGSVRSAATGVRGPPLRVPPGAGHGQVSQRPSLSLFTSAGAPLFRVLASRS